MHLFALCAALGPLLAEPMLRYMRGYLAAVSLETFKFKHWQLTPATLLFSTQRLYRDKKWLCASRASHVPPWDDASIGPSSTHRLAMCILHAHPEGRGGQAAHSQHILPFLLNSWSLQRATITALVTKSCGMEDTGAAITVATMEQVGPLLQHQMSATAPSAGRMSADKNITWGGKNK